MSLGRNVRAEEQVHSGFSIDWLLACVMILAGSVTLYVAYDPAIWNEFVPVANETPPVGMAGQVRGDVRFRLSGSSVWQDLDDKMPAREGDIIMTSDGSEAILVLDGGTTLEIGPDSMVVVQLEKEEKGNKGNVWDTFVGAATANNSKNAVLEVKKGSVKVGVSGGGSPVKLRAKGKTFKVGSTSQREGRTDELQLAIDPNSNGVKLKSSDPSRFNLEGADVEMISESDSFEDTVTEGGAQAGARASMVTPIPTAPANDMTFNVDYQKTQTVFFRWEGAEPGMRPELEVWQVNGDEPMIQTFGTLRGASVQLRGGEYFWLVRVRDEKGRRSEWSPRTFLAVKEADPPPPPEKSPEAVTSTPGGPDGLGGGTGDVAGSTPGTGGGEGGSAGRELANAEVEIDDFAELEKERAKAELEESAEQEANQKAAENEAKKAERERQRQLEAQRQQAESEQKVRENSERARLARERQKQIEESRKLQEEMSKLKIVLKKAKVASGFGGGGEDALAGMLEEGLKEENLNLSELNVKLAWEEIPDVEKYNLTILEGGTVFQQTETFEPEYQFTLKSLDHGSFFYTVEATLATGQTIRSDATAIEVGVGAPIPNIPKNGAEFYTGAEVLMTWAKTTLTKGYKFEVASDEAFNSITFSKDQSENFISFFPKASGRFFWRVRGITGKGETDWSFVKYVDVKGR